ncbi:hypothetical protein SAMN05660816_01617 [Niastella yeongjuensis]|nr:hypothetical protein SAMN05660816_01617 [Niastella yeongjuensis]
MLSTDIFRVLCFGSVLEQRWSGRLAKRKLLAIWGHYAGKQEEIFDEVYMMFKRFNTSGLWALLTGISFPLINRSFSRMSSILLIFIMYDR